MFGLGLHSLCPTHTPLSQGCLSNALFFQDEQILDTCSSGSWGPSLICFTKTAIPTVHRISHSVARYNKDRFGQWESKTNINTLFFILLSDSASILHLTLLYPPHVPQAQGGGGYGQHVAVPPFCSCLLAFFLCTSVGSLWLGVNEAHPPIILEFRERHNWVVCWRNSWRSLEGPIYQLLLNTWF